MKLKNIINLFFLSFLLLSSKSYSQIDLGILKPYAVYSTGNLTDNNSKHMNGFVATSGSYSGANAVDDTIGNSSTLSELNDQLSIIKNDITNSSNQVELDPIYDNMVISSGNYGSSDFLLANGYSIILHGTENDQIVITINGNLTIESNSQFILDGIKAENVIWNVNGNVYLNLNSTFFGIILSSGSVEIEENVNGILSVLCLDIISIENSSALVAQMEMRRPTNLIRNSVFNINPSLGVCPPNALGLINNSLNSSWAKDWRDPVVGGSPDFYHMCVQPIGSTLNNGIPINFNGNQNGINNRVSYAGIITYLGTSGYTEYIQNKLYSKLENGKTYLLEIKVSLADKSTRTTSDIGAYFSSSAISQNSSTNGYYLTNTPQIKNYCALVDFNTWYTIQEYYTATGDEEYITIGRFNDGNMLAPKTVTSANPHSNPVAVFYIGEVNLTEVIGTPPTLNPATHITANAGPDKTKCNLTEPISIGSPLSTTCLPDATFSWSPSTGLSATNIPQPLASPNVTTIYTLTVTQGTYVSIDKVEVAVTPEIVLGTEINSEIQYIPSGISTQINTRYNVSGGVNTYTYNWFPNQVSPISAISNVNILNPNILISTPGSYSYALEVFSGLCYTAYSRTFIVLGPPSAPNFYLSSGPCANGTSNNLHVSSPKDPLYYTYTWDFGNGLTATGPNIQKNFEGGLYTVVLTVTDIWGRSASKTEVIDIAPSFANYNTNCCSENISLYPNGRDIDVTIESNTVYSGYSTAFKKTIRVKKPYTLTVSNSILEFGVNGKIIVEPGATLIINNSTLRGLASCGTMWEGIEVWGQDDKIQSTEYQGKLLISGTSQINDAHKAIFVGKRNNCYDFVIPTCPPNNPEFESAKGGGIINVQGATFNRNAIDIQFAPYSPNTLQSINPMIIKGNTFAGGTLLDPRYNSTNSIVTLFPNANNLYYAPANNVGKTSRHIKLYSVKNNLDFQDNIFDNAEYGIDAVDAQFNVTKYSASTGNIFKNMDYGIYISNSVASSNYPHAIIENNFNKLGVAIHLETGRYDVIKKNKFGTDIIPTSSQSDNPLGIYFNNTAAFNITDNNFYRMGTAIQVNASGATGGWIDSDPQGNIFTRCTYGVLTTDNNSNLQIRCGKFNNSNALPGEYIERNWSITGSLADQGSDGDYKTPAGNEFLTPNAKHIYSSNASFTYNRHKRGIAIGDESVIPEIASGSTGLTINDTKDVKTIYSCTTEDPCNPCDKPIEDNTLQKQQLESDYEVMLLELDNNNTSLLLTEINNFNLNSEQLKNLLITNSPLSDIVIAALLENYNRLTQAHFVQVMDYNLPMSDELWPTMQYLLPSFTSSNAEIITEKQLNNNLNLTLTSLERDYVEVLNKRQQLIAQAVKLEVDTNEAKAMSRLLAEENENKQMAVGTYLIKGNTIAAQNYIAGINTNDVDDADWVELQNISISLKQLGNNWFGIDSMQQSTIRRIALSEGRAASNAQAVLHLVFNEVFPRVTGNSISTSSRSTLKKLNTKEKNVENKLLGVYPNPSSQVLNIPYRLNEGNGVIEIRSIFGNIIESNIADKGYNLKVIDLASYSNGIYLISLKDAFGNTISTQKLSVQH